MLPRRSPAEGRNNKDSLAGRTSSRCARNFNTIEQQERNEDKGWKMKEEKQMKSETEVRETKKEDAKEW